MFWVHLPLASTPLNTGYSLLCTDDVDLELRLARFEELMDRRPFLLSR